ncbi:hypothetical protein EYC80_008246 [Monilinia laxa]|uniref:LAGLIDADG endonuclease n=1 Tax=Monilinia laxa TaxID=61186 RepID=A0A5N6JVC0_MONLA|nr:hypothetical protein EYC80_008246 [Monilinia laxa]
MNGWMMMMIMMMPPTHSLNQPTTPFPFHLYPTHSYTEVSRGSSRSILPTTNTYLMIHSSSYSSKVSRRSFILCEKLGELVYKVS